MEGPAVYPTTAPATAPTGPNTTAPDTAPKAASPPRPWAQAWVETSVKPMTDARTNLFIWEVPPNNLREHVTPELRLNQGTIWAGCQRAEE